MQSSPLRKLNSATQSRSVTLFNVRIDADYAEPHGGFSPMEVTYIGEEDGVETRDVHVARSPNETRAVQVGSPQVMKNFVLQLAL